MSLADELLADLEEDGDDLDGIGDEEMKEAVLEEVDEALSSVNSYDRIDAVAKLSSTQKYLMQL